jgi:hypothetical protein
MRSPNETRTVSTRPLPVCDVCGRVHLALPAQVERAVQEPPNLERT